MAKGQKKSNKEARKPKADKGKKQNASNPSTKEGVVRGLECKAEPGWPPRRRRGKDSGRTPQGRPEWLVLSNLTRRLTAGRAIIGVTQRSCDVAPIALGRRRSCS